MALEQPPAGREGRGQWTQHPSLSKPRQPHAGPVLYSVGGRQGLPQPGSLLPQWLPWKLPKSQCRSRLSWPRSWAPPALIPWNVLGPGPASLIRTTGSLPVLPSSPRPSLVLQPLARPPKWT